MTVQNPFRPLSVTREFLYSREFRPVTSIKFIRPVGIDGVSCQNAILQTGIDTTIQNGQVTYDAWWEWFPFAAADFPAEDISVSAGDILTVSVTATSATSGTAEIINQSTAMAVVEDIATSPIALCMSDAEWIVEDFSVGGTLVPLANFGTVTFTGASAGTPSGSVDTSSANTVIINQNNVDLTSALISGSTVMVAYI
ncbi:uncharacterized protein PHACADRAFT_91184 [Phanerochaete carnosa HHB-10118-sp]|uniref:Uncharacterized protein n=1 Tax=Phanerochaete carnosa (strain HHB-10118-sp) TaxID=650164 RepID=K5X2G1_PHACS|nr:uncharacterized protein PHACADRAFT_91184 [Phanerochaete carnosa HHB-10118-sp]EKM56987.1 hypothetical protein PHACADRAFT_91184 [Phanerochaete carnosa HHB-10118-sp]